MAVMKYTDIFSLNLYSCKTECYVNSTDFEFKNSLEYKNIGQIRILNQSTNTSCIILK